MKYYRKMTGERIYLSPMCTDDLEKYVKWLNDRAVTDGLGDSSFSSNVISEKEWIEDNLKKQSHQYSIVLCENDELIGNIGLDDINHIRRTCTVGLFIGDEDKRNRGYGAEALRLIAEYAFDVLNMNNIMLMVFDFNERAIAAYKKVGFKEFGRRRKSYYLNGVYHDTIYMDMVSGELIKR